MRVGSLKRWSRLGRRALFPGFQRVLGVKTRLSVCTRTGPGRRKAFPSPAIGWKVAEEELWILSPPSGRSWALRPLRLDPWRQEGEPGCPTESPWLLCMRGGRAAGGESRWRSWLWARQVRCTKFPPGQRWGCGVVADNKMLASEALMLVAQGSEKLVCYRTRLSCLYLAWALLCCWRAGGGDGG